MMAYPCYVFVLFFIPGIEERVRVSVAAQATDGKANKELVLFLAKACGLKKSQVDLAAVSFYM